MLSPGEARPGRDPETDRGGLFQSLTRLVAQSGLHFIDIEIPRHLVDTLSRSFREQRLEIDGTTVWALAPAEPRDTDAQLRIDARTAVRAAFDRWLPLPLLRFIARDGDGRPQFDAGPNNWARLYLSSDRGNREGPIRGVVVLDTHIDARSRLDVDGYVAPTLDDVRFGSTFALTDEATALAGFLAEDWIQAWLGQMFGAATTVARRAAAPRSAGLDAVATYLTLLTVVRQASVLPSLQFFDPRPEVVPPVDVDLVLDIGNSRTTGLLVETSTENGRPMIGQASLLAVRDLSEPTLRHRGALESRIEFVRAEFGSDALSRRSGRSQAFLWPSVVRLGPEAVRLARATRRDDGATGIAAPKSHVTDITLREGVWRFAMDPRRRLPRSPMVSGSMVTQVPEVAGLLPSPDGAPAHNPSLRPRFSLSSAFSFLVAEIVLQALSSINAPRTGTAAGGEAEGIRRLRHIIIPLPLTTPVAERQLVRERAEAAIDMLWRAMGWTDAVLAPAPPTVRLGIDETLSAQLVFLYDEIAHRFGGDARSFLEVKGKSRPEFGVQPCMRVAALDIGGGHAHLTIVTYARTGEEPIAPTLFGAQRSEVGGDRALDHVIEEVLIPSIGRHLAGLGLATPVEFLTRTSRPRAPGEPYDPGSLATRVNEHWLRPAAIALAKMLVGLSAEAMTATLDLRLGDLAGAAGPPNPDTAGEFAAEAAAAGAPGLVLAGVPVQVRLVDVARTIEAAFRPLVTGLTRAVIASDCDFVLLTGWAARLDVVAELVAERLPWRPDRIVTLSDRPWHAWYPMTPADRRAADGKELSLVGALLALGGGDGFGIAGFADDERDRPVGGVT